MNFFLIAGTNKGKKICSFSFPGAYGIIKCCGTSYATLPILSLTDKINGDYYDGGGACDPEKVRAMLMLWGELPFDTVLPGHSPPCPREELVQWLTEETDT